MIQVFDADGNGHIDRTELRAMLRKLKLVGGDDESAAVERLFNLADIDGDGRITFGEFVRLFSQDHRMSQRAGK